MKETLVLDIDGVVLRWNSRLVDFLSQRKLKIVKKVSTIIKENKFLDTKELDKYFKEGFLNSYHCSIEASRFDKNYANLYPILRELKKEYNIIALTAFSLNEIAQKNRIANLEHHFPNIFKKVYFVDTLSCKKDKLIELDKKYNIKLFVDDSQRNIKAGVEVLGEEKVFYMKKPSQWEEIYKKMKKP